MTASLVGSMSWLLAQATEIEDKLSLDSQILAEQFYFFTVVVMWLIHVGFMSYEAGAARRKNIMRRSRPSRAPRIRFPSRARQSSRGA